MFQRHYDSPELNGLLADLDAAIDSGELLKGGNTATVARVDTALGKFVVKRYNIKSPMHYLQRAFRPSRAWVSWANTMRLEFLGISTLKPVALVEERLGPLRGRAYLITEYVDGPDATQLSDQSDSDRQMSSIAQMLRRLAEAGVSHGDLKASNFLLADEGPVIIDLDSMREHARGSHRFKAELRDRERFMKNWEQNPALGERFADLLG